MAAKRSIVQELHEIQKRCGYLPKAELEALSERSKKIPLHRLHEVASFFPHFRLEPPPTVEVKVCRDMACHLRGAADSGGTWRTLAEEIGPGEVGRRRGVVPRPVRRCAGRPDRRARLPRGRSIEQVPRSGARGPATARAAGRGRLPPEHADRSPPGWKIDPYDGREDYEAVRRFVAEPDADGLLEELKIADLRGMGGAGVWAHQKWNDVRAGPGRREVSSSSTATRASRAPSRTASCSCARRTWSSRA